MGYALSNVTLHYKNTAGVQKIAKPNQIIEDLSDDDFADLEPKGYVRAPTEDELVLARHNGEIDVAPKATTKASKKTSTKAAASEGSAEGAGAGDGAGSGSGIDDEQI